MPPKRMSSIARGSLISLLCVTLPGADDRITDITHQRGGAFNGVSMELVKGVCGAQMAGPYIK